MTPDLLYKLLIELPALGVAVYVIHRLFKSLDRRDEALENMANELNSVSKTQVELSTLIKDRSVVGDRRG